MTIESRLIALAQAIGTDVKTLTASQGALSALNTTAKSSLVAAINELLTLTASAGASIDDAAGNGATAVTWSADKIFDSIEAAKAAVKNDLTDGASAAMDTLKELATALGNDPAFAATIATDIANRVRYDAAQTLSVPQQDQARANIAAAKQTDVAGLLTGLGAYDRDYAADYAAAKA